MGTENKRDSSVLREENISPGSSSSNASFVQEDLAALRRALHYLELATMQLIEARRWEWMKAWYRLFLRPFALFRNGFLLLMFTFGWVALGFGWKWGFSLAVLCTMVPLLFLVWRTRGSADLKGFLVDIHCSDETILEMGMGHLIEWPTAHPEVGIEERVSLRELKEWVERRKMQLEREIELILKMRESESDTT